MKTHLKKILRKPLKERKRKETTEKRRRTTDEWRRNETVNSERERVPKKKENNGDEKCKKNEKIKRENLRLNEIDRSRAASNGRQGRIPRPVPSIY